MSVETQGLAPRPHPLGGELRQAAARGQLAQVRLLIRAGAPLNEPGRLSALCLAISAGSPECALALMDAGSRLGADEEEWGHTPISAAAMMKDELTLDRLLKRGALINERLPNGESAFSIILRLGDAWAMQMLIQAGALACSARQEILAAAFDACSTEACAAIARAQWEQEELSGAVSVEKKSAPRSL